MPRHSPYALLCLNFRSFCSEFRLIISLQWKSSICLPANLLLRLVFPPVVSDLRPNCSSPRFFRKTLFPKSSSESCSKLSVRFSYLVFNDHSSAGLSGWWAQVESNHRPHAYQACALTIWAMSPYFRVSQKYSLLFICMSLLFIF